jgi:MFS family permease
MFLAWQSAERQWALPDHVVTITTITLLAGIGMALIGIIMRLIGVLTERWNRAVAGQPAKPGGVLWMIVRWLLGLLGGVVVGAIAGGVIGGALANHDDERVRLVGSVAVGAFAGAALGGRRAWLVILGGALTGYFAGSEIGKRSLDVPELGRTLSPEELAIVGFAVIGAIVGAVLGVERRNGSAGKKGETQIQPLLITENHLDEEAASGRTVRRTPR